MWRIWAKALGEKSGANDREANKVAVIRKRVYSRRYHSALVGVKRLEDQG